MKYPIFIKALKLCLCCILFISFTNSFAGKIVMPWRAKKEIVKQGNSFAIWYDKDNGETINSVELVGPYNIVTLTIDENKDGSWYFDEYTEATYNCSLSVTVPAGTPIELYDLTIKSSAGTFKSRSSVKVIKEYQNHYYICHFTDPHVTVSWGPNGYATAPIMQALVEIVDIIDPEWYLCTGDNIIGFTREGKRQQTFGERWDQFFDGDYNGVGALHSSRVPLFICTGNNDYDKYKPQQGPQKMFKLIDWNEFCGMRVYGFAYDETRMLAFDDYLVELDDHGGTGVAKDFPADQSAVLEEYLDEAGAGQMRMVIQHTPNRVNTTFCDNNNVQLALVGHTHSDNMSKLGSTPTLRLTTAYVCFAEGWSPGYPIPTSGRTKMRVIEVKDNTVVSYESLYIMEYVDVMEGQDDAKYIRTTFDNPNDGTDTTNTATITNDINYDFMSCKIRFVMAKGSYTIDDGTLQQVIENDSVSVYDVKIPVDGDDEVTVTIKPAPTGTKSKTNVAPLKNVVYVNRSTNKVTFKVNDIVIKSLEIFNVNGKLITSLKPLNNTAGNSIDWDNNNSGGLYLIRCTLTDNKGNTGLEVMKLPL